MAGETELLQDIRIGVEQFAPCYALLAESFGADELDCAANLLADLAAARADPNRPERYVVLARALPDSVIALIAGDYLALESPRFAGQGIGFIEYLVTRPQYQRQGHASALLSRFEEELLQIAAARQEHLRFILGEVEPDMMPFKRKRGYRWPAGSRYRQPPIAFDPLRGTPLAPPLPKRLMLKSWGAPVEADLLLEAVRLVLERRYGLRHAGADAARKSVAYTRRHIYRPFARSLCIEDGRVVLI